MQRGNKCALSCRIAVLVVLTILVRILPVEAETQLSGKVASIDSYFWTPGIAINPHSNKVYIASSSPNELTVYNATDYSRLGTIPENYDPFAVAVNPVTDNIYVSHSCNCEQGKLITVIDGKTDKVIKRLEGR